MSAPAMQDVAQQLKCDTQPSSKGKMLLQLSSYLKLMLLTPAIF